MSINALSFDRITRMSHRVRKALVHRISSLSSTEHAEVFKILERNGVTCTHNKNGTFVNFSTIDEAVVEEVSKFTDFCLSNKQELDDYEKRMSECKINNDYSFIKEESAAGGSSMLPCMDNRVAADAVADGDDDDDSVSYLRDIEGCGDWNATIRKVIASPKQQDELLRYMNTLAHVQETDTKCIRRTVTNKFTVAKKRFCRRATRTGGDSDMQDILEME
jgi:hypothetical protein